MLKCYYVESEAYNSTIIMGAAILNIQWGSKYVRLSNKIFILIESNEVLKQDS